MLLATGLGSADEPRAGETGDLASGFDDRSSASMQCGAEDPPGASWIHLNYRFLQANRQGRGGLTIIA
jgi:hypothetical protein